jgi:hypothetical protein
MRQSIKFSFAISFMKKDMTKNVSKENDDSVPVKQAKVVEEEKEFTAP